MLAVFRAASVPTRQLPHKTADTSFTYSVPVKPKLARFAQFELSNASWTPTPLRARS